MVPWLVGATGPVAVTGADGVADVDGETPRRVAVPCPAFDDDPAASRRGWRAPAPAARWPSAAPVRVGGCADRAAVAAGARESRLPTDGVARGWGEEAWLALPWARDA